MAVISIKLLLYKDIQNRYIQIHWEGREILEELGMRKSL